MCLHQTENRLTVGLFGVATAGESLEQITAEAGPERSMIGRDGQPAS